MNDLLPHDGPVSRVVVYNTYADGRRLHFDVFIPTNARTMGDVSAELDTQALAHAKTFLRLIGEAEEGVTVSMCTRCHIDSTDGYAGRLWRLPDTDATIWPLEGCPQPPGT